MTNQEPKAGGDYLCPCSSAFPHFKASHPVAPKTIEQIMEEFERRFRYGPALGIIDNLQDFLITAIQQAKEQGRREGVEECVEMIPNKLPNVNNGDFGRGYNSCLVTVFEALQTLLTDNPTEE